MAAVVAKLRARIFEYLMCPTVGPFKGGHLAVAAERLELKPTTTKARSSYGNGYYYDYVVVADFSQD